MITDRGLYIHVPFCVKKCNYCDFCSQGGADEDLVNGYVDALICEIESYREENRIPVFTVFFGGGTPSLLSSEHIGKIMNSLREVFDLSRCEEITLEVNPGTVSYDKLSRLRNLGINRLSIGLQSVHENELKKLGRIHSFEDFLRTYRDARRLGFDNINVDLMYGIPYQTKESFKETLLTVTALSPEHISAYGLIVEEGTPFFNEADSLPLPTADDECDMYEICIKALADFGYYHYEISNYSKPGYECRHNLLYWRDMEYIGVGASAYSYFRGIRYGNTRNLVEYINSPHDAIEYREVIDKENEMTEYAMMRLRLCEGISLSSYKNKFGADFLFGKQELLIRLCEGGFITLSNDRISLTDKGMYVSNSIISELL